MVKINPNAAFEQYKKPVVNDSNLQLEGKAPHVKQLYTLDQEFATLQALAKTLEKAYKVLVHKSPKP